MTNLYPWERFWCPRGAVVKIDAHGFTVSPFPSPYLQTNKHLKRLVDLEQDPVLILLGEPGIGKSKTLEQESLRLHMSGDPHSLIALDSRDADHVVFEDPRLQDWIRNDAAAKFTLLLDGLDYCRHLLPDIGQLLRNGLRRLPQEHLRLRITCRAVEWLPTLENELRRSWGTDHVGVYHLARLTVMDVKTACEVEDIDFQEFFKELSRIGAGPLASSPVTLGLLIKLFRAENRLPRTRWDIYEKGCLRLAEELNPFWQETIASARRSECGERFVTAGRIALLSLMTNCPRIQEREHQADTLLWEEIAGQPDESSRGNPFSVKIGTVQQTLNTGLFSPIGKDAFRPAHQTYSEFLAAHYLLSRQVPLQQLQPLFSHPDGGADFPPQLSATAAWLAMRHDAFRAWAVEQDPTVLLQCDIPALPESERGHIATRLLEAAANNRFSAWDVRFSESLALLDCPCLAACVRPWLEDGLQPDNARVLAVSMADACKVESLLPSLLEIALSDTASNELRVCAGYAIANYGQTEQRLRLKVLLSFMESDPQEDLRGTALQALWPDLLDVEELLPLLTMPRHPSYHGAYQGFLYRFADRMRLEDLPRALSWLLGRGVGVTETVIGLRDSPQSEVRFAGNPFSVPATRLLQRAWQLWDDPAVQPLVVEYLSAQWKERYHIDLDEFFEEGAAPIETEDDRRKRRALFVRLVETEDVSRVDLSTLTPSSAKHPLLDQADSEWLWQQSEDTTEDRRVFYTRCAYVFSPHGDGKAKERLSRLCELYPAMLPFAEQMSASEVLQMEFRKRQEERQSKEEAEKKAHNLRRQADISRKLDEFDAGHLDEWWHLFFDFHIRPNGYSLENPYRRPITQTPAWKEADPALQSRIVASAARYLRDYQPQYAWIGSDTEERPELAGYRALELVWEREVSLLSHVEDNFWYKWAPAIAATSMSVVGNIERERHLCLIKSAYANAPEEFADALKRCVSYELFANNFLPSQLTSAELYPTYDHHLWDMVWALVEEKTVSPEHSLSICEWLLDATRDRIPLPEIHYRIRTKLESMLDNETQGVRAGRVLFAHARGAGWSQIWPLIQTNPDFGRRWVEDSREMWFFSARPLNELTAAELGDLYEWIRDYYPEEEDPRIDGVHSVGLRETIGNWRNAILENLITRETQDALGVLRQISKAHPEWKGLSDLTLPRLVKRIRERTWRAASAPSILELLSLSERRLVRSARELEAVVLEALVALQENLYDGIVPEIEFLWNDSPVKRGEQLHGRPKAEEALSNYIAAHLLRELRQRRVIVNREVQVHHDRGRLDIRVEAIPDGRYAETDESVSVVIEVKGCWNPELTTALETQLVQGYLRQHRSWRGIYLIGWYVCDFWPGDRKKAKSLQMFATKEDAVEFFKNQAEAVAHDREVEVTTFILDARRA